MAIASCGTCHCSGASGARGRRSYTGARRPGRRRALRDPGGAWRDGTRVLIRSDDNNEAPSQGHARHARTRAHRTPATGTRPRAGRGSCGAPTGSTSPGWDGAACDLLIALHARRSADAIARFAQACPDRPLMVVLTGTDLYRDLATDRAAQRSLALATHLVVLNRRGAAHLPAAMRRKTAVILQSARSPPAARTRHAAPARGGRRSPARREGSGARLRRPGAPAAGTRGAHRPCRRRARPGVRPPGTRAHGARCRAIAGMATCRAAVRATSCSARTCCCIRRASKAARRR